MQDKAQKGNTLPGRWAGNIYGTNTGNLFIELTQSGDALRAVVRIMDDKFGLTIFEGGGSFRDNLQLSVKPIQTPPNVVATPVDVTGRLQSDGSLVGEWKAQQGTAGTFRAYPHDFVSAQSGTPPPQEPEQVFNRLVEIGAVRLFDEDLKHLLDVITKDFSNRRAVVTYKHGGAEISKYSDTFLKQRQQLGDLRELKIQIQEPEKPGFTRGVAVDLSERGSSSVRVSGIDELWIKAKARDVTDALGSSQSRLVTQYRRHGLNLNIVILFAMLVFIPEIQSLWSRGLFVLLVLGILSILLVVYNKLVPNTVIYAEREQPSMLRKIWPRLAPWAIGLVTSLVGSYLFYLFQSVALK